MVSYQLSHFHVPFLLKPITLFIYYTYVLAGTGLCTKNIFYLQRYANLILENDSNLLDGAR